MNQETRDRIADEEEIYFERRIQELTAAGHHWNRSNLHHKINQELDEIRRNRNDH